MRERSERMLGELEGLEGGQQRDDHGRAVPLDRGQARRRRDLELDRIVDDRQPWTRGASRPRGVRPRSLARPQSVLKSPQFGVKSRHSGVAAGQGNRRVLQARCGPRRSLTFCLPCRRSRVRIPSAALENTCICRSFGLGSRVVRLRRWGLNTDWRLVHHGRRFERSRFAGILVTGRTTDLLPGRRRSKVRLTGRGRHAPLRGTALMRA